MVTARQPHRGNRKIRELITLHRSIDTDDELVRVGKSRCDLIFLEPVALNEITFQWDGLLLVLRGKMQSAHAFFQLFEGSDRLAIRIDDCASLAPIDSPMSNFDFIVALGNGGDF